MNAFDGVDCNKSAKIHSYCVEFVISSYFVNYIHETGSKNDAVDFLDQIGIMTEASAIYTTP